MADDSDNVVKLPPPKRYQGGMGGPKNEHGLTAREESFCQHVAQGLSYTDSYIKAYDASNMTRSTTWCRAWGVSRRPVVAARITSLTEEIAETEKGRAARVRAFIEEKLWQEANEGSRAGDRLKALEMLGKLDYVGAFRERSEVLTGEISNPEEIKARIEELVKKAS